MSLEQVERWEVVVLGAGAAGLLSAARAAERGFRTLLLEKNTKPGVKILMSGGTRCNITHATDAKGIITAFGKQGRFLHSPLAALGPEEVVALFRAEGVETKVESTGKIFPQSDRALDVQQALLRRLNRSGATLALSCPAKSIQRTGSTFILETPRGRIEADRLIVATGGCSYPGCGTTGDGYGWLREFGHTIVAPRPSLVPLTTNETWIHELSGITIPDLVARVVPTEVADQNQADPVAQYSACRKKAHAERRSSLLFTHSGFSGPAAMDVSRAVTLASNFASVRLVLDFFPEIAVEQLDAYLEQASRDHGGRSLSRLVPEIIPHRLADALARQLGVPADQRGADMTRVTRRRLAGLLKSCSVSISGTKGFAKAEVTAGGVALPEVDSRTMQSKLVPGLYLAGEILDLDGWIGGYNFQSAFSTGWLAAESL